RVEHGRARQPADEDPVGRGPAHRCAAHVGKPMSNGPAPPGGGSVAATVPTGENRAMSFMSSSGGVPPTPTLPTGVQIASFDTYLEAQRAVDLLSDKEFEVQHTTIVGTDLRMVERITGRLSYPRVRSEEHTSELQSRENLVCRLLLEK